MMIRSRSKIMAERALCCFMNFEKAFPDFFVFFTEVFSEVFAFSSSVSLFSETAGSAPVSSETSGSDRVSSLFSFN